jgi:UDP-N-acetylmuramate dehydrogenase
MKEAFGDRLKEGVLLAPYTSARIGGPADFVIEAHSAKELEEYAQALWNMEMPFRILGGGSNVLISDHGVRGTVVINMAKAVVFEETEKGPQVTAESGASLGTLSRRAIERNWSGLEWGVSVPGTIGGAVVGNAGAHGSDIASCLSVAEILQRHKAPEVWPVERFEYGYRDSVLKHLPEKVVVLSATLKLKQTQPDLAKAMAAKFVSYRQRTQPAGASWGSMFKNPPDQYAGRLIDSAGLKGLQIGGARVSTKHANFFLNLGDASAKDVLRLLKTVRKEVAERYGVELELEIELLGDWDPELMDDMHVSGGKV